MVMSRLKVMVRVSLRVSAVRVRVSVLGVRRRASARVGMRLRCWSRLTRPSESTGQGWVRVKV